MPPKTKSGSVFGLFTPCEDPRHFPWALCSPEGGKEDVLRWNRVLSMPVVVSEQGRPCGGGVRVWSGVGEFAT